MSFNHEQRDLPDLLPPNKNKLETIAWTIFLCPFTWFIGRIFLVMELWILFLLLPLLVCLAAQIRKWREAHSEQKAREQFQLLLEYLLTALDSGKSLESAFVDASGQLRLLVGRQSSFILSLHWLARSIQAGQSLGFILIAFGRRLKCPEGEIFCHSLAMLRHTGPGLNRFIRLQLDMLVQTQALVREALSDQAQKRTEAMVLCLMPAIMAGLMQKGFNEYTRQPGQLTVDRLGMLLALATSLLAILLTCQIMNRQVRPIGRILNEARKEPERRPKDQRHLCSRFFLRFLPAGYGLRIKKILLVQHQLSEGRQSAEDFQERYFTRKMRLMLFAIPVGLILAIQLPYLSFLLLLPIFVGLLQDQQLFRWHQQYSGLCRYEYPLLINWLAINLQAGLSLHRALTVCCETLNRHGHNRLFALMPLIRTTSRRLNMNWSGNMIMQEMVISCPIPEVRTAMNLIGRFEQTGGRQLLELIMMQAHTCWQVQQSSLKRYLDQQALKLILPMGLNLSAVLLVTILPVLIPFIVI